MTHINGLSEASFGEPVRFYRAASRARRSRKVELRSKWIVGLWLVLCFGCCARAQTWQRLGPEGGMVVSLGAGAKGDLYLGTADGHVFSSKDAAQSWELRGRVGSRLDAVVTGLVADPGAENRLFASAWYQAAGAGGGVFESEDGGRTWRLAGMQSEAVRALEMAPSNCNILVAGTRTGVFRSTDAGKNWERISPPGDEELRNVDSLAIDPQNPDVIYVGTYHLPWRTLDSGKTWTPVIAGIIDDSDIMSLRIDVTNPGRLFMSACSGIYRSEDRGTQWTKLQGIPYAARRTQAIVQDPGNPKTLYAGTTEGLWVTRDGGENWARTTPKDWNVNAVVVIGVAGGTGRVVLGTEGRGVQISDDAGVHFVDANHGFTHVVVRQLLADVEQPGHFLLVVDRAESRVLESRDAGKTLTPVSLAATDSKKTFTLSVDQMEQAYASPWGWLLRMADGRFWLYEGKKEIWSEWKPNSLVAKPTGKASQAGKKQAMHLQKSGAQIAFATNVAFISSTEGLLRCQRSEGCTPLKAFGRGGPIRAVSVSTDGHCVGVVRDGKLGLSVNGGESAVWRDLPVSDSEVFWLDVEKATSGANATLFLGTGRGMYISRDAGATWTPVQGGVPSASIGHLLRDSTFWVVTERGGEVYVSRDQGSNWQRVDQDAERGQFVGLLAAGPDAILAGSQSEGLLRLTLPSSEVPAVR
jgi:photosystem II stability/assembly factor-like uncharacterized protein